MLDMNSALIGYMSFIVSILIVCGLAYCYADKLEQYCRHKLGSTNEPKRPSK